VRSVNNREKTSIRFVSGQMGTSHPFCTEINSLSDLEGNSIFVELPRARFSTNCRLSFVHRLMKGEGGSQILCPVLDLNMILVVTVSATWDS
jgi:hypothetical protein